MTATAQSFLAIRCELRLPTCDLASARAILDLPENEIKELAENYKFPWWDIARPASGRMERRFLTRALRDHAEEKPVNKDEDWIIRLIYGREKPFIHGRDFRRSWNCDRGTVIGLIADGVLQVVSGTKFGRGRGKTPAITWESAIKFLRDRRKA